MSILIVILIPVFFLLLFWPRIDQEKKANFPLGTTFHCIAPLPKHQVLGFAWINYFLVVRQAMTLPSKQKHPVNQ